MSRRWFVLWRHIRWARDFVRRGRARSGDKVVLTARRPAELQTWAVGTVTACTSWNWM